jgi:hypothetical protein
MAPGDAEIAADIDDDGTDRPAAGLGGDLLGGGQVCEPRIGLGGNPRDGRRPGCRSSPAGLRFRVELGSAAEYSRLERFGEEQAAGDAREDHCEIDGVETGFNEVGVGGGALADGGGEFAAA